MEIRIQNFHKLHNNEAQGQVQQEAQPQAIPQSLSISLTALRSAENRMMGVHVGEVW